MPADWVYGAIAVLTLLHGIALLYAFHNGSAATEEGDEATEYVTEDGVECPDCGEHNEHGYRYCRRCVSELPGRAMILDGSSAPQGRRTL